MDFDLTTFILEAINFLVLVWLLTRFFYRPVLRVIEERRTQSMQILEDAATQRAEAGALKESYDHRLAAWEQEKQAARAECEREFAQTREQRMAELAAEIAQERSRCAVVDARAREEQRLAMESRAAAIAGRFAAQLLDRVADPALENRLVDLSLAELEDVQSTTAQRMQAALADTTARVRVISAWPLDVTRRRAFAAALSRLAGRELMPEFGEDADLRAGVCVMAGGWMLAANLRDELGFFTGEFAGDGRNEP